MAEFLSVVEDFVGGDADFPPSYSEATTSNSPSSTPLSGPRGSSSSSNNGAFLPSSLTSTFTSPIAFHLETLPARMRSSQQAHANEQAARDLETITVLAPAIEAFLRDLGTNPSRGPPPLAELTLVPASAVPRGWALSGGAERRREGEIVRIVRVEGLTSETTSDSKGGSKANGDRKGGKKGSSRFNPSSANDDDDDDGGYTYTGSRSEGFDEWGRFNDGDEDALAEVGAGTYFRDERMARRLAGYLQPKAEVLVERKQIQQAVVDAKKDKGFWWGRKKSESSSPASPLSPQVASPPPEKGSSLSPLGAAPIVQGDDRVSMVVRAQEVTFRKENDFGVWESRSGFGIVVTIMVKKP